MVSVCDIHYIITELALGNGNSTSYPLRMSTGILTLTRHTSLDLLREFIDPQQCYNTN